jgi:cytochrome o ubiquinol oxidase subunit II
MSIGQIIAILGLAVVVAGCSLAEAPLLHPDGKIAEAQRDLLFEAFSLMLIVVIPVFILTAWFGWRYRASATASSYAPGWRRAPLLDALIWSVPAAIIVVLAFLVWRSTHRLDPYRMLAAADDSTQVQVVTLQWKYLFIYPNEGVASVNELVFPAEKPVQLVMTSDSAMTSLMIPALGGQVYAMAGMATRLNLLADGPGDFEGRNTLYNGDGFADQTFDVRAFPQAEFDRWIERAHKAPRLDATAYSQLSRPGTMPHPRRFSQVEPNFFQSILDKYSTPVKLRQIPRHP